MAKNQKSYTPEFKQQIVDLYNAGGTVGSASVRLALYFCSDFFITVTCKFFTSIKLSCLHFGQ